MVSASATPRLLLTLCVGLIYKEIKSKDEIEFYKIVKKARERVSVGTATKEDESLESLAHYRLLPAFRGVVRVERIDSDRCLGLRKSMRPNAYYRITADGNTRTSKLLIIVPLTFKQLVWY